MHNTFLIPKVCSHNFSHWWHSWIYSFFGFHIAQLQQLVLNSGKNGGPRFESKWLFATGSPHILYHFSASNQYHLVSLHIYLQLPSSRQWKRRTVHQFPLHSLYHNSFVMKWSLYISSRIWQISPGIPAVQGRAFLVCHEIVLLLLQLL